MANKYYFTKVRGLATVIWDPEKNRSMAEFDKQGLFETSNRDLALKLLEQGYRQVTSEQIQEAGLMLPDDFAKMRQRKAGKGYSNDPNQGPEGGAQQPATVASLFEPETPVPGKKRTLIE